MRQNKIGFIGLGKMGAPMAKNLLKAGFSLTVYDREEKNTKDLVKQGAKAGDSPKNVAKDSDVVWIMVPAEAVNETVLGEEGILQGMKTDGVVIDGGNSKPANSRKLARIADEKSVNFLDVGCSGGPSGAEQGTLVLMVGGQRRIFERCRSILDVLGEQAKYFGPSGNGHLVKVINNVLVATSSMAISEALSLAIAAGLNPEEVAAVMNGGVARGWLLELAQRVFADSQGIEHIKGHIGGGDTLRWGIEAAHELEVPLPMGSCAYMMRKLSRLEDNYMFKINSALRQKFGGHDIRKAK
jgi:2-hydroxy-3-oxopropionate reductase